MAQSYEAAPIGTCGRCGSVVEEQHLAVVDRIIRGGFEVVIEYLITNLPCGDSKHSPTGNGVEALRAESVSQPLK